MSFGGDLGLVVASSLGKARAVLVCTVPLQGLCATCVQPVHTPSSGGLLTPDHLETKLLSALPLVGSSLEFLLKPCSLQSAICMQIAKLRSI